VSRIDTQSSANATVPGLSDNSLNRIAKNRAPTLERALCLTLPAVVRESVRVASAAFRLRRRAA